jgi:putative alpha-1,2-mannosidase
MTLYGPGADGLPGNDDGGAMSAWWIYAALGFYPLPGSDRYIVAAPLFPHAEVQAPGGLLVVEASGVSDTNQYVQGVTLNGAALDEPEFRHADIVDGGTLVFEMGPEPSAWGRR